MNALITKLQRYSSVTLNVSPKNHNWKGVLVQKTYKSHLNDLTLILANLLVFVKLA